MIGLTLAIILAASAGGSAGEPAGGRLSFAGPAPAIVERVVDGDTVKARVAIWIDQELIVSVRLADIDAPELFRPKCAAERERAQAAKAFVEAFLSDGAVTLSEISRGKYAGRVVARVEADGRDLSDALVAEGLAVNAPRGAWCD